jgi:hypothetical protein
MVKITAGAVAMVALMTAGVPTRVDAAQDRQMVVVLQVTDEVPVPLGVLAEAEQLATRACTTRPVCELSGPMVSPRQRTQTAPCAWTVQRHAGDDEPIGSSRRRGLRQGLAAD